MAVPHRRAWLERWTIGPELRAGLPSKARPLTMCDPRTEPAPERRPPLDGGLLRPVAERTEGIAALVAVVSRLWG